MREERMARVRDYLLEARQKPLPDLLERELEVTPTRERATTVIGPRRAGKTYYLFQWMKKGDPCLYLNFEDTRLFDLHFREIREILRIYREIHGTEPTYVFLDEIQSIPHWEQAVRELLDLRRYFLFLTGSSSKLLSREIASALRGRTYTYLLLPFSFREFVGARGILPSSPDLSRDEQATIKGLLETYLEWGGFPEVVLGGDRERLLREFADLILFRDIVERHRLRNAGLARFLLSHLLQNFATEISVHKIFQFFQSQGRKVGKNTLYHYLDSMEDACVFYFLRRYSPSVYQREGWPQKVYLADTGLSKVARFAPDLGKRVENAVFLELLRQKNQHPLMEVYSLRIGNYEVDFLIQEADRIRALIQVCVQIESESTLERETRALQWAAEKGPASSQQAPRLLVLTWDQEGVLHRKGWEISLVPLWRWLLFPVIQ